MGGRRRLAADAAEHGHEDASKRRTLSVRAVGGALILDCPDPPPATAGMMAAARAVSAETCDRCGGRDRRADRPAGRRTRAAAPDAGDAGHAPLPRAWTPAEKIPDMAALSPGQHTQDLRGESPGTTRTSGTGGATAVSSTGTPMKSPN